MKLRHKLERVLEGILIFLSMAFAISGNWQAAQYFVTFAAVVEIDDWLGK